MSEVKEAHEFLHNYKLFHSAANKIGSKTIFTIFEDACSLHYQNESMHVCTMKATQIYERWLQGLREPSFVEDFAIRIMYDPKKS